MDAGGRNAPEGVLLAVTSLLLIFSTLFTTVRCWAKTSQQLWSVFDTAFIAAFAASVTQCIAIFLAVAQYGFGTQSDDVNTSNDAGWQKALYTSDILYLVSIGLSRCSMALFLSSLTCETRQIIFGMVMIPLVAVWTVTSVLLVALRGDITEPWMALEPPFARWIGIEASGLAIELACWLFAVSLVYTLNMPLFKRLKLVLIFATRLTLAPIIALRLRHLSPSFFYGSTQDLCKVLVFTLTAMHFAIISECLTTLRPFMKTFHEGLAPGKRNRYWSGLSHNSRPLSSASGAGDDRKKCMRVLAQQISEGECKGGHRSRHQVGDEEIQTLNDGTGFTTRCVSMRDDDEWAGGGVDHLEVLPSSRSIHVRQTAVMSVS